MACTSGWSPQLKDLKLSDTSRTMNGSNESEYLTIPASEGDHANTSSPFLSARNESIMETESGGESGDSTSVEEQIEQSKSHWSLLADQSSSIEGEEVAEVSNVEEFKALQRNPTWGSFFRTFGYDLGVRGSMGEMEVGEKFAEGGQAELYDAQVTWSDPWNTEQDLKRGTGHVLKVFKKGTFLKHLKSQLPHGLLQFHVETMENMNFPTPKVLPMFDCNVYRGTLLKDGRFAFLMKKEHFDLRKLIECNMESRSGIKCGPFSKEEAEGVMYLVALGVNWLHNCDIVHRDLKASNVLVYEFKSGWPKWVCFVADYECSIGVVGTGFFRAPEILQACKERKISQRPEVFSRAADVYSFGMVCFEILTGKLPFEDHPLSDNFRLLTDLVIHQHLRPEVPEYVEDWTRELLGRCWQCDPIARPAFGEILDSLLVHSIEVRKYEDSLKRQYGQNFRIGRPTEIANS